MGREGGIEQGDAYNYGEKKCDHKNNPWITNYY
jgi:hypothetical protein